MYNPNSLDTLCAALCYAMGIEPPKGAAPANSDLCKYVDEVLFGGKVDKIFMYNPDAVAQWIFEKYPHFFGETTDRTDVKIPLCSVLPSVTPVCFGTMYTGVQPMVHGIQKYEKPVITVDTIFDVLIRAGKKPVILSYGNSSLSKIYLERDMDYYFFNSLDEVNAKAAELIITKEYDFYVVYNGNYDALMHKFGPESAEALAELRANTRIYNTFDALIKQHWKKFNTLVGFAMDHGCHEIDGNCGSHGLDMEEDLNITHLYKIHHKNC